MKKQWMILLGVVIAMSACTDPKQEKVDALRDEAIDLHDEVMPRMGEIMKLTSTLKELRKEAANDTTDSTGMLDEALMAEIKALEDAHEGMMAWMGDYKPNYESDHPLDSAVVYYEQERLKIKDVKNDIEKSIENARATIEREKGK